MAFGFEPMLEEFAKLGIVFHHKIRCFIQLPFADTGPWAADYAPRPGTPLRSYYRPNRISLESNTRHRDDETRI